MKTISFSVLLGLSILLTTGCSSMENAVKSPFEQGRVAALSGELFATDHFAQTALQQEYLQGYQEGLVEFCSQSPQDIVWQGLLYQGSCDAIDANFASLYDEAYSEHIANELNRENESNTYNGYDNIMR